MITHARGAVEYQETGEGAPLVFVPGSFSTGASWRNISVPLSERYRTITTSLSGYGKTQERRTPGGIHMQDEMDVLETVLAHVDAPVHLVAHSFGAWVALSLAIHRKPRLLSLTLLEPTVFTLLALAGETALSGQVHAMKDGYVAAWHSGDQRAVRHVIDFYGGAGTFDAYPAAVQDRVVTQTPTNILDWESGFSDFPTANSFATVNVPTLVICGNTSHMAMQRCNQLLVDYLPQAKFIALDGANHFMIVTHPADLTQQIDLHIRSVQAATQIGTASLFHHGTPQ